MFEENWGGAGRAFGTLGLDPRLAGTLDELAYEEPTSLQRAAIPRLLDGRDVVALAASGSGKTAAFVLALVQRAAGRARSRVRPTSLVIVASRERATRVAAAIHRAGRAAGVEVLPLYEGQAHGPQARGLERGADVVVATPARALEHIRRGALRLDGVAAVVLDDADRIVEDGPEGAVEEILAAVPRPRQIAIFSATFPPPLLAVIRAHIPSPDEVRPARPQSPDRPDSVRQVAHLVAPGSKLEALGRVFDAESPAAALVFCRNRREAVEIAEALAGRGLAAAPLHAALSPEDRARVADDFRAEVVDVLVATDAGARGLDLDTVPLIVHHGLAPDADTHSRRLALAATEARSVVLAEATEFAHLRQIERALQRRIEIVDLPRLPDLSAPGHAETCAGISRAAADGGLDAYRGILAILSARHDLADVALAAIKRVHQLEGDSRPDDEPDDDRWFDSAPPPVDPRDEPGPRRPDREAHRPPGRGRPLRHDPILGGVARLFVGLGRQAGVLPKDLVGAIANEAGIPGNMVGAIDIAERFSLVEVPADVAEQVIEALRATKIRGKKVVVRHDHHAEP